jgi:large subunit ribosomal protein L10
MLRADKEQIVAELVERLRTTDTLIVADYRGLTVKEVDALRTRLLEHGARFTVVKNSLTRRAAEAADADALLALLDGPTAIAFIEADGDTVAVAKALADTARTTRVLAVRGGIMQGQAISADEVQELAKLPPVDVLRGQVLGAIAAPVYTIVGLLSAPLRDLHGLIQARIDQLGGETAEAPAEREAEAEEEPKAGETTAQAAPEAERLEDNPADSSQNGGEASGLESAEEEE